MLSNVLNTNEVKDSAAAEIEFQAVRYDAQSRTFAKIGEAPSLPVRLSVKHQEVGTGFKKRRRSVVRVDITTVSTVDNVTPVTTSAYIVLDAQEGALANATPMADAIAMLGSFVFTQASSTLLYNGTGNGAAALLAGSL